MRTFEKKGWFRLAVPDGWEVDEDEEPIAVYNPDGAGALQVTAQTLRPKPGEKIDVSLLLKTFLLGTGVDVDAAAPRRFQERGLDWVVCEYAGDSPEEGRLSWRTWMATNQEVVAFLTYACREEDKDAERDAVDGIIGSLELL